LNSYSLAIDNVDPPTQRSAPSAGRPVPGGARRLGLVARLGLWGALAAALAGCQPGVRWRLGFVEDALAAGRAEHKLTFVYFRNWYSVECTDFEEHVLQEPRVLAATAGMVCVPLELNVAADRHLAESWGIKEAPGFAIVDPTGAVLETGSKNITVESLLAAMQRASGRAAPTAQKAGLT
jgi:hypothetical protein